MRSNSIPASAQFSPEEYLTEREMSSLPVLLVEGDDDSIFFQLLKDEVIQGKWQVGINELEELIIDSAAMITSPESPALGNREKVEYVCGLADEFNLEGKLIGFVDREFREFQFDPTLIDLLGNQNQQGILVWSKGHSIENYFFEFDVLRNWLRDYSINPRFDFNAALSLFRINFEKIILIACAVSFSAKDVGMIAAVPPSLSYEIFDFDDNEIFVNSDKWKRMLSRKSNLDESRANNLILGFNEYSTKLISADANDLKMACHGHISFSAVLSAFCACIVDVCRDNDIEISKDFRPVNKIDRFIKLTNYWIELTAKSNTIINTPVICFKLLGLICEAE